MKASQLDKLLDCNCDTCDFKHYRNTEDCDTHRKKAILLALKEMVLGLRKECHHVDKNGFLRNGIFCDRCVAFNRAIDSVAGLFTGELK